jgi:hypothetical protein
MAGHRRVKGKPARSQIRAGRIAGLLSSGSTPEEKAAGAFDGLRMAASHSPRGSWALEEAASYLRGLTRAITEGDR